MIDKPAAICGIGFVLAACGCIMLKSAIENIIHGRRKYARLKGFIILGIACGFITVGIVTILETAAIIELLSAPVTQLLDVLGV
jgi:hypothetical protein